MPTTDEIKGNSMRSRLATLLKILCYKTNACDFIEKNENILSNNIEKHHFFPRKLVYKHYPERADLLPNCVYITSMTNKKIGSKEPYEYINEFGITKYELMAHLIPLDESLYRLSKYEKFLERRAELIYRAVESYVSNLEQNKNELNIREIYEI